MTNETTYTAEQITAKGSELAQAETKLAELDTEMSINPQIAGSQEGIEQMRRWSDQRQVVRQLREELDHMRRFAPLPGEIVAAYWRAKKITQQSGFTMRLPFWDLMIVIGKLIGDNDLPGRSARK